MNKSNRKYLWQVILQTGDELKGKLPNHPNHSKGRNPYAHVAVCIREHFKCSYKDIPDDFFSDVLQFLDQLKRTEKFKD
mgnify:FL=1